MSEPRTAARLLESSGAAFAVQLSRVGIRLLTQLVLRRLVTPSDWGLWTWAETLFLLLTAFRDLGLPGHVIRLKPRPFGNFLRCEALWGLALALVLVFAAPLVALLNHAPDPLLVGVVRVLALHLLLDGLAKVPLVYFEAELELRRTLLPELLRNLCFAALAIGLAYRGHGVWSIVLGHVVSTLYFAVHLWLRAGRRLPLHFERGATLRIVRGGLPLAFVWLLLLLVGSVDALILGARFPREVLGAYGFACFVAYLASRVLVEPVGRVLYPALLAYRGEPARMQEAYRLATAVLMSIEVPVACFVFLNADLLLALLGGGHWAEAAPYLRILAFAPVLDPISRFGGDFLMAEGRERGWILATLLTLATLTGAGLLLTPWLGPAGMAWAKLLPLGGLLLAIGVRAVAPAMFRVLLADLAWIYLPPLPLFALCAWLAPAGAPRVLASCLAVALALAWYAWRFSDPCRVFFARAGAPAPASASAPEQGEARSTRPAPSADA